MEKVRGKDVEKVGGRAGKGRKKGGRRFKRGGKRE